MSNQQFILTVLGVVITIAAVAGFVYWFVYCLKKYPDVGGRRSAYGSIAVVSSNKKYRPSPYLLKIIADTVKQVHVTHRITEPPKPEKE